MEVASTEVPNGVPTPPQALLVDSGAVIQYLTEVLQVTLGALKTELESTGSLLSSAKYNDTVQRCTRFASEAQVALYVQKDLVASEETNGTDDAQGTCNTNYLDGANADASTRLSQHRLPSIHTIFPPKSPLPPRRLRRLLLLNDRPLSILRFPSRRRFR